MKINDFLEYVTLVDGSRGTVGQCVQITCGYSKGKIGTLYRAWRSNVDNEPMTTVCAYDPDKDLEPRYLLVYPSQLRKINGVSTT